MGFHGKQWHHLDNSGSRESVPEWYSLLVAVLCVRLMCPSPSCSSPSERAYEVDTNNPNFSIPAGEKENSIFVSALKKSDLKERIDRLLTDAAAGRDDVGCWRSITENNLLIHFL